MERTPTEWLRGFWKPFKKAEAPAPAKPVEATKPAEVEAPKVEEPVMATESAKSEPVKQEVPKAAEPVKEEVPSEKKEEAPAPAPASETAPSNDPLDDLELDEEALAISPFKPKNGAAPAAAPVAVAAASAAVTPELIAAVSAAIAEEMGTDISAIRIVSMKKI